MLCDEFKNNLKNETYLTSTALTDGRTDNSDICKVGGFHF